MTARTKPKPRVRKPSRAEIEREERALWDAVYTSTVGDRWDRANEADAAVERRRKAFP